jgi:hypothetical protein
VSNEHRRDRGHKDEASRKRCCTGAPKVSADLLARTVQRRHSVEVAGAMPDMSTSRAYID